MRHAKHLLLYALFALPFNTQLINAQKSVHPLDPLSWQEYWTVLEVLRDNSHLDEHTRFSHINLVPPDKAKVWHWNGTETIPRSAFAVVHQGPKTYRAEVSLTNRVIEKWEELSGIQPTWLDEEFVSMAEKVKQHPDFIAAMKARGYDDLTFIEATCFPPGYFGTEEQSNRRIAQCTFEDARGVRNLWSRQIEGLTAIVDMHAKEVVRIVDEGIIPVATVSTDYDQSSIPDTRSVSGPFQISQPGGAGFTLNGHILEWQKWKLHIRPDHRVGTIISTVTYQDGADIRKVLYEGHLSEIFVPYMDPTFSWYQRNFIDAGEYTAGGLTKPLLKGQDAPDYAYYMDGLVIQDNGRPSPVLNMIAIFERETGDPSWRHYSSSVEPESRAKRDLVIRCAAVLGNYDYIFDWVLQQDGSIRVLVGATGIAEAKATVQKDAAAATMTEPKGDAYGRFVDPHIVAVNHDHFFSYRLDLDVDGSKNSLSVDRLTMKMLPDTHPRRSLWVNEPIIAKNESEAKLNPNHHRPALWRCISNDRKNHVGYPTSYQLLPGHNCHPLLSEDDYPRKRAGFINNHLWVTPYSQNERFAAGDFPTLSLPGKGLPEWTSANRAIENTDIVLWYTVGMHHMVRAEDWPVMPVLWHSFELRPYDFFNRNPALDLPK